MELEKNSTWNILSLANYYYETNMFEFSQPDFCGISKVSCADDPDFINQWGLNNTGQYGGMQGNDISICEAWEITAGSPDITIAVIDNGVDLNHPDLQDNLVSGYDATDINGNEDCNRNYKNDAHGTACAGIIAACNNDIGISGIAYNCRIMPIKAYYLIDDEEYEWHNEWLANAIEYAWKNGVDILSNSWETNSSSGEIAPITSAIDNATTLGRNGLGCPVIFGTGNYRWGEVRDVMYPANLPNTIAVGAITMCGSAKTLKTYYNSGEPEACSGDDWFGGSCYGNELDVMAPGVRIPTTDILGSAGYNDTEDYFMNFKGTSSACPHVSGIMALILSINSCLTLSEAKQVLELSCDKIGAYCYSTNSIHPNGSWNNEMGYGRVNAYNAVRYAFSTEINTYTNISGTDAGLNDCGGFCQWVLINGGCTSVATADYIVKIHVIEAYVTYPYTSGATIIGSSNGFSYGNPNLGYYYMGTTNITPTSATLFTYTYEIYNILGSSVGWIPFSPQNIRFNYTVLSTINQDLFLQNQTITTGTEVHNAMNKIEAGSNVTNTVPVGDYIVQGDASVTLHGGNSVTLEPGTIIQLGPNGSFVAYADPFFTCSQYPIGKMANPNGDNSGYPPVIKDYEVTIIKDTVTTTASENNLIRIFPNPFKDNTTIEYRINKSASVTITIHDNCGKPFYILKNKSIHEAGTYQIKLTGINLPSGVYICTLQADNCKETKQMIKIE